MEDNRYFICMLYAAVDSNSVYTNEFTYHTGEIVDGISLMGTNIKTEFISKVEALAATKLIFELYPAVRAVEVYKGIERVKTINRPKSEIIEVKSNEKK
jgi:hypothetical protein